MRSELSETTRTLQDKAARIVADAGGEIVGRTKLQKTTYLLHLAGFEPNFRFSYKFYGPYSEELAEAVESAVAFDVMSERQQRATWGGRYSIYTAKGGGSTDADRVALARAAAGADAVLLELAATAAYVRVAEGRLRPWAETAGLKPDKAKEGRLERARELYGELRMVSRNRLPDLGDD